jgi:hypothetical protein
MKKIRQKSYSIPVSFSDGVDEYRYEGIFLEIQNQYGRQQTARRMHLKHSFDS